ncbi:substrate-binding periplasmic protein [Motiliproteus sediminis]|uniref:substrate-binding periplasmic protein n=1 Tax=Motiliproteus sediminis TaxID=1468178 RepID=UPI001AEF6B39|nr:ABC transporter substrate-binding protein [Motiliproteus sediminis]
MTPITLLALLLLIVPTPTEAGERLAVGIGASVPPYVDARNDTGIELEIISHSLAIHGYEIEPIYLAGTGTDNNLRLGRLDALVTNSQITPRASDIPKLFAANEHIQYQNYAITLARKAIKLHSVKDLAHHRVVAFYNARQALGEDYRAAVDQSPLYRELPLQRNQVLALVRNLADVVIADQKIFSHFRQQLTQEGIELPEVTFHPLFPVSPRRVLFTDAKVREQFDRGLEQLRNSGKYQQILNRNSP